jgi:hypothetical protein
VQILTLQIKLSGWRSGERAWSARIEVPEEETLTDLHYTIQKLVNFDDDHLYEFYVGPNWRQPKIEFGEPGSPLDPGGADEVKLSAVFPLPKGCCLYYHFDFGDDWVFEIRSAAPTKPINPRTKYPRTIERKGRRPSQYGSGRYGR